MTAASFDLDRAGMAGSPGAHERDPRTSCPVVRGNTAGMVYADDVQWSVCIGPLTRGSHCGSA